MRFNEEGQNFSRVKITKFVILMNDNDQRRRTNFSWFPNIITSFNYWPSKLVSIKCTYDEQKERTSHWELATNIFPACSHSQDCKKQKRLFN